MLCHDCIKLHYISKVLTKLTLGLMHGGGARYFARWNRGFPSSEMRRMHICKYALGEGNICVQSLYFCSQFGDY